MKYYKCLTTDHYDSNVKWPPIGVWTTWRPITSGYHVCKAKDLVYWLNAKIFEVEVEVQDTAHRVRLVKQLKLDVKKYVIECNKEFFKSEDYLAWLRIPNQLYFYEFQSGLLAFPHKIRRVSEILWRRLNEDIC